MSGAEVLDNMSDPLKDSKERPSSFGDDPFEEEEEEVTSKRPECFSSTLQEVVCITCCAFTVAASSMTTGFCQLSLSKVSRDFNEIGGDLTWATGSVGLGAGSFLLIMGGVSDAFGRKKSLLASLSLFVITHLICGFLHNFIALCIVRALIGVVVSAGTPSLAAVIGANYKPGKRKNRAFATFSAGAPLGFVFGLLIGGISSQLLTWRAGHWFFSIFYSVLVPLSYWSVPLDPKLDRKQLVRLLKQLDYVGAFISLSGFTLFCFALTQVDATAKGWKTPYILVTFLIGFLLIVSLPIYETYIPSSPLMPMKIWKQKNFAMSMLLMALCFMDFQGVLSFYSVLYFEEIRNYSPLHTAACALTMGIGGILVNLFAALTLHIIPGTLLLVVATSSFALLAIIWETMSVDKSYWLGPFWAYLLAVVGADLAYNVVNMIAMTSVDASLQSSALGIFNTVIQLSGTVGLGISSAMVSARYPLYGTSMETKYPDRLWDGFKNAYWLAFGCGCAALCCCVFIRVGVVGVKKKLDDVESN